MGQRQRRGLLQSPVRGGGLSRVQRGVWVREMVVREEEEKKSVDSTGQRFVCVVADFFFDFFFPWRRGRGEGFPFSGFVFSGSRQEGKGWEGWFFGKGRSISPMPGFGIGDLAGFFSVEMLEWGGKGRG